MSNRLIQLIANFLVWVVLIIGLSGTIPLVSSEFTEGNICPKIAGIPACYIILCSLIFAIISQAKIFNDRNGLYFIGVAIALSIATFASIGNILGYIECPKTENGTPMCYLSFLLFFSLWILKMILVRGKASTINS